jgi:hypothetical protein
MFSRAGLPGLIMCLLCTQVLTIAQYKTPSPQNDQLKAIIFRPNAMARALKSKTLGPGAEMINQGCYLLPRASAIECRIRYPRIATKVALMIPLKV